MTKEIVDIITAYKEAHRCGRQVALATVVHVEGSSYRRPGARMLVEDNGKLTGAISGGCLEGDALRKALLAINQRQNKLVTYNTLDGDDVAFGVQLGCNGIVHILFEPIDPLQTDHPVALLEACLQQRKDAVLATLFSLHHYHGHQPGTCLFTDGAQMRHNTKVEGLAAQIENDAAIVLAAKASQLITYSEHRLEAFIELVEPPVSLVIVGAGNDALPLVEMAGILGWQTTLVDGRPTHANRQRFPKAHHIIVGKPAEAMSQMVLDDRTVVVLMTHNYNYDLELMEYLLQKDCSYIGTLGPKKRLERMIIALEEKGFALPSAQSSRLYGPTGLDIGAEAAEEIALSILAEIKAVLTKRKAGFLRDRADVIHPRSVAVPREASDSGVL